MFVWVGLDFDMGNSTRAGEFPTVWKARSDLSFINLWPGSFSHDGTPFLPSQFHHMAFPDGTLVMSLRG